METIRHTNLRSLLSFLVITIFGAVATIFIIQKAQGGVDELERINDSPQMVARREFIRELLPSGTASEWRLYQSRRYGFELFYPPDYTIAEHPPAPDSPFILLSIEDQDGGAVLSVRAAAKNKNPLLTSRGEWIAGPCTGSEFDGAVSPSEKKFRTYPARVLAGTLLAGEEHAGQEVVYTCIQSPKSSLIVSYLDEQSALAVPILDTMRFIK
jgi:hypothetical protein